MPLLLFIPVPEFGHNSLHMRPDLFCGPLFARHMFNAKVNQLLHIGIFEFTATVAPFAVFLVEISVRFPACCRIIKRHTAALAYKLPRSTQNVLIETSKSFDNNFSVSVFGTVSPVSQRDTACLVTNTLSASSCCYNPLPVLSSSKIFFVSIKITSASILTQTIQVCKQLTVAQPPLYPRWLQA